MKYQGYPCRRKRVILYNPSLKEGARGVIVIVVENGHGDTSSNPARG